MKIMRCPNCSNKMIDGGLCGYCSHISNYSDCTCTYCAADYLGKFVQIAKRASTDEAYQNMLDRLPRWALAELVVAQAWNSALITEDGPALLIAAQRPHPFRLKKLYKVGDKRLLDDFNGEAAILSVQAATILRYQRLRGVLPG